MPMYWEATWEGRLIEILQAILSHFARKHNLVTVQYIQAAAEEFMLLSCSSY